MQVKSLLGFIILLLVVLGLEACGPSLAERKDESKIHFDVGVVHLNERNIAEALKELITAIEIYPGEPSYHNALGLAYFAKGMNDEAKASIKKALDLDPDFSEAHLNLSAIYIADQNWEMAINESKEALGNIFYRTPERAHNNIGWAYYNMGKYKEALSSFKKAVELNPGFSLAYYNMGLTYAKLKDIEKSAAAFEKAVKISPGYVEAYLQLGMARVRNNDIEGARWAFQRIIELNPGSEAAKSARDYIELMK